MSNSDSGKQWFAYLDAGPRSSVVIGDKDLPTPAEGRLYLYNLKRDAIIEYVEAIVRPKLRPLESREQAAAREAAGKFNKALQQFMRQHREWQEQLRHRWPQDVVSDVAEPAVADTPELPDAAPDFDDAMDSRS